jgi:hypothetical protein
VDILQKRLVIYYTKNPYFLRYHYKIYKPLKDIIIEIIKRALEDLLKELSGGKSCKKKENYTVNRASKKHKA